jgi:hypothetical protein
VSAADWLADAPAGLVDLMRRMTWHHKVNWNAPDYAEDGDHDSREVVDQLEAAEALSSQTGTSPMLDLATLTTTDEPKHMLAIDVDVPAWLLPSSTPGHSHLYVDLAISEGPLWAFLDAAAAIGLVEEGYVSACKSRGMTSLRAPWVRKGAERPITEEAF